MECAIIIVNYRTPHLVIDALASLSDQIEPERWRVVIVDNCSGDDSVPLLQNAITHNGWRTWVEVIESPSNSGFSYGNNLAISKMLDQPFNVEYFWLLNPDTVVLPGAVHSLRAFLQATPEAAIVGTKLLNSHGRHEGSAHRMMTPFSEFLTGARLGLLDKFFPKSVVPMPECESAHKCDWVSGASMVVRSQVFKEIGLLDEGYFLYFEELDFCLRAIKAGWQVWFLPIAEVIHLEGASTEIKATNKRKPSYWFVSRRRFFLKHYGMIGVMLADLCFTVGRMSLLLRSFVFQQHKLKDDARWLLRDMLLNDVMSFFPSPAKKKR